MKISKKLSLHQLWKHPLPKKWVKKSPDSPETLSNCHQKSCHATLHVHLKSVSLNPSPSILTLTKQKINQFVDNRISKVTKILTRTNCLWSLLKQSSHWATVRTCTSIWMTPKKTINRLHLKTAGTRNHVELGQWWCSTTVTNRTFWTTCKNWTKIKIRKRAVASNRASGLRTLRYWSFWAREHSAKCMQCGRRTLRTYTRWKWSISTRTGDRRSFNRFAISTRYSRK